MSTWKNCCVPKDIAYPYGAHNDSLIEILKRKGCKLGLTTKVGVAEVSRENAFTLERLDTNDILREQEC